MAVRRLRSLVGGLLSALLFAGCAIAPQGMPAERPTEDLNAGYSLLYDAVSGLQHGDRAFYVKFESDPAQRVVSRVADYAAALTADLERVEREFPAVDIRQQPLPLLERRKRQALRNSNLKRLAPVVGETGPAFERTLLLSTSGALNQLRFHAQVMAQLETDPALQSILRDAEQQFAALYVDVVELLNAQYFRHDTFEAVPSQ